MSIDFANTMKDKTKYLSMQEIDKILSYCYNKNRIRDYMLILTLVRTGRRISEILGSRPYTRNVGFRPCDIMPDGLIEFDILKKNHIKLRSAKTGKMRDVEKVKRMRIKKMPKRGLFPVDDEYLELIKLYIEQNNISSMSRIFSITRQRFDVIIKDICKKLNITRPSGKISAHNFRHSFAINLLKDNPRDMSVLMQIKDLLAHSDLSVTAHYTMFSQDDKKEKLDKLFNKED